MNAALKVGTDADGTYRFTAVTPGDYVVVFELAGFSTVRNEGIRVSLGFTATVNAELKVASLQESVTVTGQSPVVDTSATQIGNTFNAKQLSALPTSRDYFSLLAGSPAVQMTRIDVGGSTNGTQQGFVVYGTTGQVRVIFEGINATEATGAFGNYPDVGGMEEVQINTAAHSAEASTPGVQSQFISKSGGNQFRGTFFGGYSPESWQAFNIDDDQIARGLTGGGGLDPEDVNRLNQLPGHERRPRRLRDQGSAVVVRLVPAPGHPGAVTSTSRSSRRRRSSTTTAPRSPTTCRPTTSSSATRSRRRRSSRSASTRGCSASTPASTRTESTTWNQNFWAWVHKARVERRASATTRSPRSAAASTATTGPTASTAPGLRYEDIGNNIINGRNRNWARERRRNQVLGTISYFKNDWAGDHNFKIGGEVFDETVKDIFIDGFEEDILHVMQNNAQARRHPVPARRRRSAACGPTARSSTTRGASATG